MHAPVYCNLLQAFRVLYRFIFEMMQVTAIVTKEDDFDTVHELSNGDISNDIE